MGKRKVTEDEKDAMIVRLTEHIKRLENDNEMLRVRLDQNREQLREATASYTNWVTCFILPTAQEALLERVRSMILNSQIPRVGNIYLVTKMSQVGEAVRVDVGAEGTAATITEDESVLGACESPA